MCLFKKLMNLDRRGSDKPNIIVSIDSKAPSSKQIPSSDEMYYIFRTTIYNNGDFEMCCTADLEDGFLQRKDVGELSSKGTRIPFIPTTISSVSFGKDPVFIPSHSKQVGDFVFRAKADDKDHVLKIIVKNLSNEVVLQKEYIVRLKNAIEKSC